MDTNKLVGKLEEFFDLSKKKQRKKRDKLLKIIGKLEEKKAALESELAGDSQSDRYQDLKQELQVVSELIDKARQQEESASVDDSAPG
jgi:ribonuclease HII